MTRGRGRGRGRGACGSSQKQKRPPDAVEATDTLSKKQKVELHDMLPQDAQKKDLTTQKTYTLSKAGFDTRITVRLDSKSFYITKVKAEHLASLKSDHEVMKDWKLDKFGGVFVAWGKAPTKENLDQRWKWAKLVAKWE